MDNAWGAARFLVPSGLVVLAGLVVADTLDPDVAIFVVASAVLALLVAFVPLDRWRKIAARLEKAEVFGIAVGLREDAARAAKGALPEEQDREIPESDADEWLQLRLNLEAKLAYIAKTMRPGEEKANSLKPQNFVTVGSLHYDKYLTDAEAHTATAVLAPWLIPVGERKAVLKQAAKVIGSIRASVFFGMVRSRLDELCGSIEMAPRDGGLRPDLFATKDGRHYRVVSAFATSAKSEILAKALTRVKDGEADPKGRLRIIVIPDSSETATSALSDDPRVVRLNQLEDALSI